LASTPTPTTWPPGAWDAHGNPVGEPVRFGYDLSGTAGHRDAQVRHALIRLLHWAGRHHLAIAIEDLDFQADKTRERHGRRKLFRNLISSMPLARLRARLVSMAAELGITIIAVDPAYTSRWGAQHWQNPSPPTTAPQPATTQQPWRSAGAPWGTRSGDGRHAPCSPE
jgi:IS605 OrfB family transposase